MQRHSIKSLASACCLLLFAATAFGAREKITAYASHQVTGNTVLFTCQGTHKVKLTICTPLVVRVEFDPKGAFSLPTYTDSDTGWNPQKVDLATYVMKNDWPSVSLTVTDATDHIKIKTGGLTVRVYKSPLRVQFWSADDLTLINKDPDDGGMECQTGGGGSTCDLYLRKAKASDEHFYGFSDLWRGPGDYAGQTVQEISDNQEARHAAPFFYSTAGYGIFAVFDASFSHQFHMPPRNTHSQSSFDMGASSSGVYTVRYYLTSTETYYKQYLIYYFMAGPGWDKVIEGYTSITGRPTVYAKWVYGVQANNFPGSYGSTANCKAWEDFIKGFRSGSFPLDVMFADDNNDWGVTSNSVVPGYTWFADATNAAYYSGATNKNGDDFLKWCHAQGVHFGGNEHADLCQPYKAPIVQTMVDRGFDVYWRDMTACGKTYRESKTSFENFVKAHKGDASLAYVRHGWATWASQAWGPYHQGDNNMPAYRFGATLAASTAAYPWTVYDSGIDEWSCQIHSLTPMIFFHPYNGNAGTFTSNDIRPWSQNQTVQDLYRKWIGFHYQMMPYIYSYSSRASVTGLPMWRHMAVMEPKNSAAYSLSRQAWVGDWLIFAPYHPAMGDANMRKSVYLPAGTWYDFFEGKKYTGGATIQYDVTGYKLPLFVKEGAIIPTCPSMQYVGQIPEDPLTLKVWPAGSTSFEVWEDEKSVKSTFTCTATATGSVIGIPAFGGSTYSPSTRKYELEVFSPTQPKAVFIGNASTVIPALASKTDYDAQTTGWCYVAQGDGGICYVKPGISGAQGFSIIVSNDGQVVSASQKTGPAWRETQLKVNGARSIAVFSRGEHTLEITDVAGRTLATHHGKGGALYSAALEARGSGVYYARLVADGKTIVRKLFR